jgi:hypothetical protein
VSWPLNVSASQSPKTWSICVFVHVPVAVNEHAPSSVSDAVKTGIGWLPMLFVSSLSATVLPESTITTRYASPGAGVAGQPNTSISLVAPDARVVAGVNDVPQAGAFVPP